MERHIYKIEDGVILIDENDYIISINDMGKCMLIEY